MDQNNGGIIGKINTPTTSVASGVWSLDSQFESQSGSTWPLAFPQTTIANSCRFNDGSADNLSRTTWATPTSTKIFTMSVWVKRTTLGATQQIVNSFVGSGNDNQLKFKNTDAVELTVSTSSTEYFLKTNRKFRDVSAWYNIVFAFDSTQATSSDRYKLYINGTQETSFSSVSYPPQDTTYQFFNNSNANRIGVAHGGSSEPFDGYMAEFIFIDGQALAPTSFGATNPVSNIWEPIAYAGTYGNNGFRLDFANSSALGTDVSGNSKTFTVNNLTSVDQSTDTCSNNFSTFNSIATGESGALPTFGNGNLDIIRGSASWRTGIATIGGLTQGKWYYECKAGTINSANAYIQVGVSSESAAFTNVNSYHDSNYSYAYHWSGQKYINNSASSFGTAITTGDIVMIALDFDNNYIYAGLNGTWQNSGDPTSGSSGTGALSSLQSGESWFPSVSVYNTTHEVNFGSPSFSISSGNSDGNGHGNFEYAVPSGYYTLNTKNLAEYG